MGLGKIAGTLFLLALPMASQAVEYYRYVDERGITVINRQGVPREYIANGYEVLNERGRVIRTVPRAPTPEEYQKILEAREQEAYDRHLLRLYSMPEDVDRARERRFAELEGLIARVRGNLLSLTDNKAELLNRAANIERAGRKVPEDLLQDIEKHEQIEQRYLQEIEDYGLQKEEAERAFMLDKQRVMQLTGKK